MNKPHSIAEQVGIQPAGAGLVDMSNPFIVREVGESEQDPFMHPVPTAERDGMSLEPSDGVAFTPFSVSSICVARHDDNRVVLELPGISATGFITNSRVAVVCTKYDRGGGWIGGPSALLLNAASKALASARRRGKSLVGHIRYPWLAAVAGQSKEGWRSRVILQLVFVGADHENYDLLLDVPPSPSPHDLAADIARRAAVHRLEAGWTYPAEDDQAELEALSMAVPRTNDGRFHVFPSALRMSRATADLREWVARNQVP